MVKKGKATAEPPLAMKRRRDRPSLYSLLVLLYLYGSVKAHGNEPVRDIGGSVLVPMPEPGRLGVKVRYRHAHAAISNSLLLPVE